MLQRAGNGHLEPVGDAGLPLGFLPDAAVPEAAVELAPGDRVFLYTDGAAEVLNSQGNMFGHRELAHTFARVGDLELPQALDAVLAAVDAYRGDLVQRDDIVLIGVQVE
jgi:sigma-B regulation protein RsbU (phosphoserine phosphatase)